MGYNAQKLKLSLKLLQQRVKQMILKKQSLSQKTRREIANLIQDGKHESARIRVEAVIQEDYLVEAFEVIGLLSEVLVSRFGMMDFPGVDPNIQEAVNTLLYVTPRCNNDLKELQIVSSHLKSKFGPGYAQDAMQNRFAMVNPRVVGRLNVEKPADQLVTAYLREICKTFNVPFNEAEHLKATSQYGAIGASTAVPLFEQDDSVDLSAPVTPPVYAREVPQARYEKGKLVQSKSLDQEQEQSTPKEEYLPQVPSQTQPSQPQEPEVQDPTDFDELSRRFEELKKRK